MEAQGFESPTADGASLPTMTFEQQWDEINYHIVIPTAHELEQDRESEDEFMVRVHRRIGAMNRAILSADPRGYLRWLVFGIRRAVWGTAAEYRHAPDFSGSDSARIGVHVRSGFGGDIDVTSRGSAGLVRVGGDRSVLRGLQDWIHSS